MCIHFLHSSFMHLIHSSTGLPSMRSSSNISNKQHIYCWRFLHVGVHQCYYPSVISRLVDSFLFLKRHAALIHVVNSVWAPHETMRPCSYSVFFSQSWAILVAVTAFKWGIATVSPLQRQIFGHLSKNWFHQPFPVIFFCSISSSFLVNSLSNNPDHWTFILRAADFSVLLPLNFSLYSMMLPTNFPLFSVQHSRSTTMECISSHMTTRTSQKVNIIIAWPITTYQFSSR